MKRVRKSIWALTLVTVSLVLSGPAWGWIDEDDWNDDLRAERMAADTLVVRPVGIAATVVGSVFYVISLPFSYNGGNQYEAQQALVEDPARQTFQRPLGRDF